VLQRSCLCNAKALAHVFGAETFFLLKKQWNQVDEELVLRHPPSGHIESSCAIPRHAALSRQIIMVGTLGAHGTQQLLMLRLCSRSGDTQPPVATALQRKKPGGKPKPKAGDTQEKGEC
jgi:hypothetical protein